MPKQPKYLFSIKQLVEVQKVRLSFSECWPSSDDPQDRRPVPEYLFLRGTEAFRISEPELDRLVLNNEFTVLRPKHGENLAYRRFHGTRPRLTATRLLETVVMDDTRADLLGRPIISFGICSRTRTLLGVTVTFEDPSLSTALAALKRIVQPMK